MTNFENRRPGQHRPQRRKPRQHSATTPQQSRPQKQQQQQKRKQQPVQNPRKQPKNKAAELGFNLPDLKKLPNTKFNCDDNDQRCGIAVYLLFKQELLGSWKRRIHTF